MEVRKESKPFDQEITAKLRTFKLNPPIRHQVPPLPDNEEFALRDEDEEFAPDAEHTTAEWERHRMVGDLWRNSVRAMLEGARPPLAMRVANETGPLRSEIEQLRYRVVALEGAFMAERKKAARLPERVSRTSSKRK